MCVYLNMEHLSCLKKNIAELVSLPSVASCSCMFFFFFLDRCPDGFFRHPYKSRCYRVMNTPKRFFAAMADCSRYGAQLAIISNDNARLAIWDQIVSRSVLSSVHIILLATDCSNIKIARIKFYNFRGQNICPECLSWATQILPEL